MVISISGSNTENRDFTTDSNPLKTLSTIIRAAVPTATPTIEMPEIKLMILCDFFEMRYLRAMKNGRFKT
jgi:hypothetical protein